MPTPYYYPYYYEFAYIIVGVLIYAIIKMLANGSDNNKVMIIRYSNTKPRASLAKSANPGQESDTVQNHGKLYMNRSVIYAHERAIKYGDFVLSDNLERLLSDNNVVPYNLISASKVSKMIQKRGKRVLNILFFGIQQERNFDATVMHFGKENGFLAFLTVSDLARCVHV